MLIDMHIHTYRYSGCSMLDPVDIVRRAEELGLGGIVLTEHDCTWSGAEIEELRQQTGTELLILRGQEVSSPGGHVLVYGCYEILDTLSTSELLRYVHARGAVALPSHPFRFGDFTMESLETLKDQLGGFDGFEALNGNQNAAQNAFGMDAWEKLDIPAIGGSDGHFIEMIGRYVTEFEGEIREEQDLVREIRAGRCRPVRMSTVPGR
jgi:predicted metal-dependent phosphoesterase TrpH